jgi:hypothetical protein
MLRSLTFSAALRSIFLRGERLLASVASSIGVLSVSSFNYLYLSLFLSCLEKENSSRAISEVAF